MRRRHEEIGIESCGIEREDERFERCDPTMEKRLAILQAELDAKKAILDKAYREAEEMAARIEANLERKDGLCIRVLNKKLLAEVLKYLGPESSVEGCVQVLEGGDK